MGKCILVIDDDRILQALLQELLEDEGYQVDIAIDGLDALEKLDLQYRHYDMILLDLTMPRMNGLQLLQVLQQRETDSLYSIIAYSGDNIALQQADRMGVGYFLRKPFDLDTLLALIAQASEGEHAPELLLDHSCI
jgi:Response regulator containing CheY-like receiver, AAA-type ATPase, and DNA-binding domains